MKAKHGRMYINGENFSFFSRSNLPFLALSTNELKSLNLIFQLYLPHLIHPASRVFVVENIWSIIAQIQYILPILSIASKASV